MSSNRRTTIWAALWVIALLAGTPRAVAQELEISVSPTPVGSGARAAGMADAFVAIADDATAASWNPAGLVQLERPELSIVGSYNALLEKFGADYHREVDSRHTAGSLDLNYLSFVYPLPFNLLGRNTTVSLNYQRKYDFSRKFGLDYFTFSATQTGRSVNVFQHLDFEQDGGLSTISPAFAIEVNHRLSLGVAVNFWRSSLFSDNRWEQRTRADSLSFFGGLGFIGHLKRTEEYEDFQGENLTLGALWSVSDRWTVGARYDTAFTGDVRYTLTEANLQAMLPSVLFPLSFPDVATVVKREKRHVRFPDTLALGVARRVNDRLTLAADVARTDWNDFYVKDASGHRWSLIDFSNLGNPWTRSRFDPTYTVRVGAEYVFVPEQPEESLGHLWTLRGGLFYDEEPASGRPSGFALPGDNGSGKPDAFYGFAAGIGFQFRHRVNVDAAYQLRYGDGVNHDFVRGISGFREDVLQHRFLLSTVIYF